MFDTFETFWTFLLPLSQIPSGQQDPGISTPARSKVSP
jgi:hypothetical protein